MMSFSKAAFIPASPPGITTFQSRVGRPQTKTCSQTTPMPCTSATPIMIPTMKAQARLPNDNDNRNAFASYICDRSKQDTKMVMDIMKEVTNSMCKTDMNKFIVSCMTALMLSTSSMMIMPDNVFAEIPTTVPTSTAIYDDANVVPKSSQQLFNKVAGTIETKTGYRLHFVIARSLPFGETPTEFADELASSWGLESKDILFVASTKLARAGVFVGSDAKSLLNEEIAQSIAEETYGIPAGDERYSSAVLDVSNRLIPVLSGESDPGPPEVKNQEVVQTFKTKQETKSDKGKYIKVVGGILVISVVAPLIQTYWYVRDD